MSDIENAQVGDLLTVEFKDRVVHANAAGRCYVDLGGRMVYLHDLTSSSARVNIQRTWCPGDVVVRGSLPAGRRTYLRSISGTWTCADGDPTATDGDVSEWVKEGRARLIARDGELVKATDSHRFPLGGNRE